MLVVRHMFTSLAAGMVSRQPGTAGGSELIMMVKDGMSQVVLSVGPAHTLREAARMMAIQRVGAAVVQDPDPAGIGILTERHILNSMGANQDPDSELVSEHRTTDVVFASPEWTLQRAAETMVPREFRHLIVVDGGEVTGLLSMRDIVRCWSSAGTPLDAEAATEREAVRTGSHAR